MLTESFVAATLHPPKNAASTSTNASLRDASIFHHNIHPQPSLRCALKKSATTPNCVAVNSSHIFAAQKDKAVVHVYSFDRDGSSRQDTAKAAASSGKHEATFPFPERITGCTLVPGGVGGGSQGSSAPTVDHSTHLALGTESGRLILWSLATGETINSAPSHLKPVTSLVADCGGDFVLSGAADSTVHVWSVLDILASSASSNTMHDSGAPTPRTSFTAHKTPITSIATGHAHTPHNITISASKDATVHLWAYRTVILFRTFLLPSTPLCLTLDPADRAFFAGCSDGGVACLELYDPETYQSHLQTSSDQTDAAMPIQPPSSSHWPFPSADASIPEADTKKTDNSTSTSLGEPCAALSISLSHSGTTLITGHAHGTISTWDVGSHPSHYTGTVSSHPRSSSAAVTNLHFLPLMPSTPRLKLPAQLPKPLPVTSRQAPQDQVNAVDSGAMVSALLGDLKTRDGDTSAITAAMRGPGVPQSLLMDDAAMLDDLEWHEEANDGDENTDAKQPTVNGTGALQGQHNSIALGDADTRPHVDKKMKHDLS
ncbi:MAG: Pre-rRNA-processing protein ipi3 [Alyxoria varia]|nr:MAG: Pre-rRNA-processing protein ipi3 [Alyxoria varia]